MVGHITLETLCESVMRSLRFPWCCRSGIQESKALRNGDQIIKLQRPLKPISAKKMESEYKLELRGIGHATAGRHMLAPITDRPWRLDEASNATSSKGAPSTSRECVTEWGKYKLTSEDLKERLLRKKERF